MLGGADTKKIFLTKNLKRGLYKKAPLTQYLKRGWHKKVFFAENYSRGMYVGICFNLLFPLKMLDGAAIKKASFKSIC